VHFNTVAQAYRELEAEGWLRLKRRSGTVVRERATPELESAETRALQQRFARELHDLLARYEALGLDRDMLEAVLRERIEERRDRR
jgi:DNA-binding transcriptional regulator YhcF (GntR family)